MRRPGPYIIKKLRRRDHELSCRLLRLIIFYNNGDDNNNFNNNTNQI